MTRPPGEAATPIERFGYRQELSRSLSFTDLLVYGLIFMVPIAPFGIFGSVYAGSGGMVALAYLIGMIAMMFTALSYAQMVRAFPMAGSVYSYAGRGIAPPVGFLAGWVILLDYILVPGLLYLVASVAMHSLVPAVPVWAWLAAFVVLNTVVNYLGIRMTARVNRVMLAAELIILAIFLVVGVVALAQGKGDGFSLRPLFDSGTFSWPLVFGAVSIAVLSFLGFDGISMLAEESREEARQIGRAMVAALLLAGTLFIVQTWVAALLVPDTGALLADGDPEGTAFYDAARVAGGGWLAGLTALATAIAWGFANSLVAQAATSRLLYAMARDGQMPRLLARVNARHRVPANATLLVAGISLALGLWMASRDDGISLLSTLVNFGAMTAFLALHVSVVVHYVIRNGSRDWVRHLLVPVVGFVILLFVVINAKVAAQVLGFVWLGVGVLVLLTFYATGRRPELPALTEAAHEPTDEPVKEPG
ncbi:amino acid/polyamine/organocation transporter (APC superfamily) [Micromonospora kangleipakensis]|uniref:Amino acid/polyamine/organocation transporter (APC superfamily) n=1 Tax=Micromonospora kangleipakensis TaxID=1077942 RepID=A0A4Q8B7Q3_9ACTN|nr:APC family permease [Micromonospora kangleipakensis]RZU73697.1 amino acid/polyamine/organocation transporter (APC superfamily) [Micromonospora kangleipakensis]